MPNIIFLQHQSHYQRSQKGFSPSFWGENFLVCIFPFVFIHLRNDMIRLKPENQAINSAKEKYQTDSRNTSLIYETTNRFQQEKFNI
jgi:hypothetical protein